MFFNEYSTSINSTFTGTDNYYYVNNPYYDYNIKNHNNITNDNTGDNKYTYANTGDNNNTDDNTSDNNNTDDKTVNTTDNFVGADFSTFYNPCTKTITIQNEETSA